MASSAALKSVKVNTLTIKNMGADTITLDPDAIKTYRSKIKKDYDNICSSLDTVAKYVDALKDSCGTSGAVHDAMVRIYKQIKTNKKSIMNCAATRKEATLKRIDKDINDYSDALLGKKLQELEAKIAELEAKLSQMEG